jgi:hypothetical protein
MASVRIEDSALTDPRFVILGKRLCTSHYDAIGRMIYVWSYCTDKQLHVLTPELIDTLSGYEGFHVHLIEIGLAEELSSTEIRICGTKGRIEWIAKLRKNGRKGGRPKKTKTKPDGLANDNQTLTKTEPPSNPLTPSLTLTTTPVIKNKETTLSAVVKPPHARKRNELVEFHSHEELKAALASKHDEWSKLYPDEQYRDRELIKAFGYYQDNPRKRPTTLSGWKRTFGSWLERGWARHVAQIPGHTRLLTQEELIKRNMEAIGAAL